MGTGQRGVSRKNSNGVGEGRESKGTLPQFPSPCPLFLFFPALRWLFAILHFGFQVTGMIEGFYGAWNLWFRDFLGRKIWHLCFWAGLIEVGFILGIQNNVKIRGSPRLFRRVPLGTKYNQFVVYKFLRLGNSEWDFLGVNFCLGIFWGTFCSLVHPLPPIWA